MNFDSLTHTYKKGEAKYKSVSQFLNEFKVPFNEDLIAAAVAKKRGITQEEVISEWRINGDISLHYGSAIHCGIEYWIKYGQIHKQKHIEKAVKAFQKKYKRENLKSEIVVSNDEYKIAGTIDQIEVLGDKKINIIDVKTSAELSEKSYNNYLSPLDNIKQTKLNDYRLQLSMYKSLAEKRGVKVVNIILEHWDGTKYETIKLKPINVEPLFGYRPEKKKTLKLKI